MVRETRHLWVGNLPDNIREDRIREHFKRYGRVQSVKLLPRCTEEKTGEITMACTVAFMDIKSASKAHNAELKIDDRTLNSEYYEPAAIPSAASPQNTPSPYSTSPGSTRFPNGHGSSDEHGTFPERFYDRSTPRVASESEFIRRTGYHDTNRGRNRDRSFRNGPYNPLMDRHSSRTLNSSWTYDSTRYNNTTGCSQTDTGYSTTPSDNSERRNSDQSTKKKTKSRSGSRSPSPSGSTSSRSPSRSRSQSSSSSSSSSTSRDTSSTGSPKSRRVTSITSASHQTVHSDDRRPLAICVKNLPVRSSDTSLKDGLFHEYKKHGKVTWVKVVGQNSERHAIVCFKKPEDVEKALEVSYDKLFFGCKIEVAPYMGYDVEDNDLRPYEAEIDEFHPKATRTLFIGNLEKDVTASDLRKHFDQFGEIIEIDIKKQGAVSSYAFCQYSDIVSVVKAIRKMDGEHLGNNRIKLGFGKSMPYNCLWIDGVNENVNDKYLKMQFEQFGDVNKVHIDREKSQALIFYEQVSGAQSAVNKMRGFSLKNTKLQVDYASRECQESFFERLEKQGAVLDRTAFEERKESTSRPFDPNYTARFSRYDTPTRPRTSSYSSRSSVTAGQVPASMQSPDTPGSVTPRGTNSRSRLARFAEYYDPAVDYPDRHFRSYDEYSQGSAASHEDPYEHEYFVHDSPTHIIDPLEPRTVQNVVDTVVPFAPPDIRNLQKERVHLLEQLEECPSSGDEVISPKKRLKLEILDAAITSDVIIEANRDHRKVMEVRRLSDANIKHHSRRPSIDSGKHSTRDTGHDRTGCLPHTVCKRRKTAGSDSGSKGHHYDHSGSESVGGSRPGTPLVDEKPENFQPSEPRRIPREREGPLTLPLPRFAAQVMSRGSVSVAGIKGQKDSTLSSPPPAVTSPRISNPRPPSPVHVPPPASPPPRPPSLSSNSSDSDITPPSPSLEERIKSLDEKYEKWSGTRALSAAGGDALAMLDANLEKFRLRHKLLDLDLKEVQPSEIVKSVMAKRSVFDEDLKRLENVGEKYEPKEFSLFPRAIVTTTTTTTAQTSVPTTPLSAPPTLKLAPIQLPKTPTMLSPRSAGTGIPTAKGLQYPFPTHPPLLMSPVPSHPQTPTTPTTSAPLPAPAITSTTTTITIRGTSHGDNRLKPCASVSSDTTRTSSKVNVNKSTVVSSLVPSKTSEKTNANIPNVGDINTTPCANSMSSDKHNKAVREVKSSDKTSEKISNRRDSNSSSPRADIKTRRNSDTSARRIEDSDKFSDADSSNKERAKSEERKKERFEKVRLENDRLEKEKLEKERTEKERLEKERQEKERLETERLEKERLERESELEKQQLEKERLEKERIEREKQEKERAEKARVEKERAEKTRQEKERLERERLEKENQEKERLEKERKERERREKEERERKEREEKERREREREEKERRDRDEQQERERLEKERKERERKEKEERERKEREEREAKQKREEERLEKEKVERERAEKEKLEKERKREEDRARHKEDNHDRRKDDHHKQHRENHSEAKHRENNLDKHLGENKNTKDSSKEEKSSRDSHDARSSHEKSRHHGDRDSEKRKESIKENRDNNIHDKHKNDKEVRTVVESRHMSIDLDKNKYDNTKDPNKRRERNNSLPANIGSKRRLSSHESLDCVDENKKIKLSHEHKKLSDRRDGKDGRLEDKSKSKHKNNVAKTHDKHNSTKDFDEKRKEKDREERHKRHKLEKQKSKSKSREKESRESPSMPKSPLTDKDFLARLDLKSNEEIEKQQKDNKESRDTKEKRKDIISTQEDKETKEKSCLEERMKKEKQTAEKQQSAEKIFKCRSETESKGEERKKRERIRKMTNSSDSDSDEPKKHSIFDIVDDEPAYISMYDKVKARSCKNMAKQEEEKRQEKIKAKFSQLKQSRAKREEKKRSTSWDEDSDSDIDLSEMKTRRSKMLIDSSDDESRERKSRKTEIKEMQSDSDSCAMRIKKEHNESSEDEVKNKSIILKACKPMLSRDTSEDDYSKRKIPNKIKSEILSDPENSNGQGFTDVEEKPHFAKVKDELDRLIKKERRNSKHQDSLSDINTQFLGSSPLTESKLDKFNNRHSIPEITTDEETAEIKKERSERREKKHKRKQKKQKHSLSDESSKLESLDSTPSELSERSKHHEKKKDHSKKEKRRDKTRDRSKKSKKKLEIKFETKREGKMENIFGSLSEDSDNGAKEIDQEQKSHTFLGKIKDEPILCDQSVYNSESEREQDTKSKEKEEREREREEHKRRKEKKRREKERRLQEAAAAAASIEQVSNENSMDYADMGKQLEENMMKDESFDISEDITKSEIDSANRDNPDDPFHFNDISEVHEIKREKDDRKEGKEKKKKRKKSKEERGKHHHHHHHHEKNKSKTSEFKEEVHLATEIKTEIEETKSQSLPSLVEEQINPTKPVTPDFSISPQTRETNQIISPIPKTPTSSKEKKREKLLPGFGTEIDEKIHESAVKSISGYEPVVNKDAIVNEDDTKEDKQEEKPRVIISQEETEDAVAALLGESFGGGQFEECYSEEINNTSGQTTALADENNVQDDEEMRQAVQSLSANDLDIKPDTPQSEHELQIDTDTEEQEECSVRFDQKTPDVTDLSQPPKTPDITNYYRSEEKTTIPSPLVLKPTNIGSPPSLTPIKHPCGVTEVKKSLDMEQKSLPMLPEQQQRSVIAQPWSKEKIEAGVLKTDSNTKTEPSMPSISENTPQSTKAIIAASTLRQYNTPVGAAKLKESHYPPLKAIITGDHIKLTGPELATKVQTMPLLQTCTKSPTTSQLHNLPARSPVQMNKLPSSIHDSGLLSPKSSGLIHNRLPITSVMVSKPLQASTVILQQSKVAHTLEPPKLVSTSERIQDRPRMVFQTSTMQSPQFSNFVPNQPRMMIQGNIRHLPPQGLLVPTRQLPPNSYSYLSNISPSTYSLSPTIKENMDSTKSGTEHTQRPIFSMPSTVSTLSSPVQQSIIVSSNTQPHSSAQQPLTISAEHYPKVSTPVIVSPNIISTPSPKPFMPASVSPKPCLIPANTPSPKPLLSISSPKSITPSSSPNVSVPASSPNPVVATTTLPSSFPEVQASVCLAGPDKKAVDPMPILVEKQDDHLNIVPEIDTAMCGPNFITSNNSLAKETQPSVQTENDSTEPPPKLAIEKVTEELNMFLEKESPDIKEDKQPKSENTLEVKKVLPDSEPEVKDAEKSVEPETSSVIKEIEKFDEEKADTESIISDISKERSSADILTKEDPLDTKEDSDYWSAKEVNIDSVIKTLCSGDELSDHSSENGKDEWFGDKANDSTKSETSEKEPATPEKKPNISETPALETSKTDESENNNEGVDADDRQKGAVTLRSSVRNRGGRGRGRGKSRGGSIDRSSIQTRRGKLKESPPTPMVSPTKRGRGGRPKAERKTNKSESEIPPADVYEFRDEFDDANKERPRLILTIKSPAISSANSAQTTAIVKEVTKDGAKEIGKEQTKEATHSAVIKVVEAKEEFTSPTTNTRKSRRLQEKDTRNTIDDTIEDVVKNTIQTRAAANQRRSTRQGGPKQSQPPPQQETPRKSPRGRKPRRGSEATENSSSEDTSKEEIKPITSPQKDLEKPIEAEKEVQHQPETPKEKPHEGLKAAMLRRIKGELANVSHHEPTNLIDPVTGELIPMRESEEGKYIPLPGSKPGNQKQVVASTSSQSIVKLQEPIKTQSSVITQSQPVTIIQPPKPQSLKAHVLSSQAAQANVTQQMPTIQTKPAIVQQATVQLQQVVTSKTLTPVTISKSVTPIMVPRTVTSVMAASKATSSTSVSINKTTTPIMAVAPIVVSKAVSSVSQNLNINTSLGTSVASSAHLSPRPTMPVMVTSKPVPKQLAKPPVLSPVALSHPKQILQPGKQSPQITKGHMSTPMVTNPASMINTQIAHMKQHQNMMKQQVIIGKSPAVKPTHSLHQQQILTGAVPSPPLGKSQTPLSHPSRIIHGPTSASTKGVMEPPKVDVSIANVMLGQRPKLSPQGPQRLIPQAGIPVPGYEASLGEVIAYYPPGPLRPPDLSPAHYMHPSLMQYQQFLRQQQLQHLTRSGGIEKVGDGQEGEEAPITSPPLELRRPGSVGLALTGRGVAVPHSLHSPHDRATDSPQVGQVYNVHSARMQHYHPGRYYDQTEPPVPPPAHRQQTSHSSLAALGSDRGLAHMAPMGTPDRPLSGHSALTAHMGGLPDKPLSSHIERPLSAHSLMGAGLGAAGNLMGAVARHIGADAPTSQRGLQAATPPHASQVPPQAESLFMLLKQYPCMWQGLLALKNDQAAVQMYFVSGNDDVAKCTLPKNLDGSTPPLRIFQRMRLEPTQVEGVARKMQMENEHCMLLALPCGHDHMDVLKQSTNLTSGFITYLQQKQAAGIINVAAPGTTQPPAYVVHIFPSCDFVNENLRRIAPSLLERVADIAHLLIVITTV